MPQLTYLELHEACISFPFCSHSTDLSSVNRFNSSYWLSQAKPFMTFDDICGIIYPAMLIAFLFTAPAPLASAILQMSKINCSYLCILCCVRHLIKWPVRLDQEGFHRPGFMQVVENWSTEGVFTQVTRAILEQNISEICSVNRFRVCKYDPTL